MDKKRFELTETHIKLLRRMCVYWDDDAYSGAPAIDIKRPYGNSGVMTDIAEIIGIEKHEDDNGETYWPKGTRKKCESLHRQMDTALQVCLEAGSFKPGIYEKEQYFGRWEAINEYNVL